MLSSRALRNPSSTSISTTAKAAPATEPRSRHLDSVRFRQASGMTRPGNRDPRRRSSSVRVAPIGPTILPSSRTSAPVPPPDRVQRNRSAGSARRSFRRLSAPAAWLVITVTTSAVRRFAPVSTIGMLARRSVAR